jgi:hypothetical protein
MDLSLRGGTFSRSGRLPVGALFATCPSRGVRGPYRRRLYTAQRAVLSTVSKRRTHSGRRSIRLSLAGDRSARDLVLSALRFLSARITLVLAVVATASTSACGGSADPSVRHPRNPTVANAARGCDPLALVARGETIATRGKLVEDIDDDGKPEEIRLLADYEAVPRCRFVLAVGSGEMIRVAVIRQGITPASSDAARETPWPRLVSVIQIGPHTRGIAVLIDRGASTDFATVFFGKPDRLVRPTPSLNRFAYGSSGLVAEAVDCSTSRDRPIVSAYAAYEQGRWSVSESFFRLDAAGDLLRSGQVRSLSDNLARYPEFGIASPQELEAQPFPSCTVARVAADLRR